MSKQVKLGARGEELAAGFLSKSGYEILERNWRYKRAEIDIICRKDDILVFVEVKTRSDDYFGRPEDFVTSHKEDMLSTAAPIYMESIGHEWALRFDVIGVLIKNEVVDIQHFTDVFFPEI